MSDLGYGHSIRNRFNGPVVLRMKREVFCYKMKKKNFWDVGSYQYSKFDLSHIHIQTPRKLRLIFVETD